jgi:hypothetical protein
VLKALHEKGAILLMRYFTAHVGYVGWFGRSPFRNYAVGRENGEGEVEWLKYCGVTPDEEVREGVRRNKERGVWTGLEV